MILEHDGPYKIGPVEHGGRGGFERMSIADFYGDGELEIAASVYWDCAVVVFDHLLNPLCR